MALEELQDDNAPLRMAKGQKSFNGLHVLSGQILEDCNQDLRWPYCMETYKQMFKDATISPALNFMEMQIAKTSWKVKIPEGHEEQLAEKAKFLESVMTDMEHTWNDFIRRAATFNRYGFAPIEKVYRRRTKSSGSNHNDGYIGLRSLPLISQDTVDGWKWTSDGRYLSGLEQMINIPKGKNEITTYTHDTVFIPRNKFILFRADPQKDSPIGTSPLNGVYVAWRFKGELERYESTAVGQDLRGLKVFKIPARYMSDSASEDEKATYEEFKKMLRGLHNGEQSGVIIPSALDQNGKELFSFELMSVMGQAQFDIDKIITRFRKEIVTGILSPQLIIGQDGSGSFALSESLENITDTVVGARLTELKDQLNHDLVKQLFQLNGWDTTVMPYFDYEETKQPSVDDLGKYIQRVAASGLMKVDSEVVNWVHSQVGMPQAFDDTTLSYDEIKEHLTGYTSNSGEGLEPGTSGNGTAKGVSTRDNSIANLENA